MKLISSVVILIALLANSLLANHIDFVSDGGLFLSTTSSLGVASDVQVGDPGNILGSEREVSIDFSSGSGILSTGIIDVPVGPGPVGPNKNVVLLFDNSVEGVGSLLLTYNGPGSAGLGGVDLDTSWDAIAVDFSAIQGDGRLAVELTDTAANKGTLTQVVSSGDMFLFPFDHAAYSSVDVSSIDAISLELNTITPASDFAISQITLGVIPEPDSHLLAAAGLLALISFRTKRV